MTDMQPPGWDGDSLSKYFRDAEYNERVTAINYPEVFRLLRFVQATLELVEEAIESARGPARPLPQFLLVRAHSAFLASVRLAMSGQSFEAQVVLRSGIESAWYALHMATDPVPGARARPSSRACTTSAAACWPACEPRGRRSPGRDGFAVAIRDPHRLRGSP